MKMNNNEKGFSLVELLVVVIIIAIVAAIAIPNLLASRRAANEASAVSSLRTIHSAEVTYFSTTGQNALYGSLTQLNADGLIDTQFTNSPARRSGYDFVATLGASGTGLYCATAAPVGTSGMNFYGVGSPGVIYKHTAALTCAGGALTPAGNPIQ